MKKIINKKDYKKIEKIRPKNNTSWMQILNIAFMHSPKKQQRFFQKFI